MFISIHKMQYLKNKSEGKLAIADFFCHILHVPNLEPRDPILFLLSCLRHMSQADAKCCKTLYICAPFILPIDNFA